MLVGQMTRGFVPFGRSFICLGQCLDVRVPVLFWHGIFPPFVRMSRRQQPVAKLTSWLELDAFWIFGWFWGGLMGISTTKPSTRACSSRREDYVMSSQTSSSEGSPLKPRSELGGVLPALAVDRLGC